MTAPTGMVAIGLADSKHPALVIRVKWDAGYPQQRPRCHCSGLASLEDCHDDFRCQIGETREPREMAMAHRRRCIGRTPLPHQQIAGLMGFDDQRHQTAIARYWRARRGRANGEPHLNAGARQPTGDRYAAARVIVILQNNFQLGGALLHNASGA